MNSRPGHFTPLAGESAAPLEWQVLDPRDVLDLVQYELPLDESEARYVAASRAPSTLRGYRHDWLEWCDWSANRGHAPLPARPDTLAKFIAGVADAGAKRGTISRKLAAIRYAHTLAGLDDPTASARVRMTWDGIRRELARYSPTGDDDLDSVRARQARLDQAPPLMPPVLWDVLEACPTTTTWTTRDNEPSLAGARDRALLLMGFFGALRRSEIARVRVEHLHPDARGLVLEIPWSKTDQHGKGQAVALPRLGRAERCPVQAIEQWRELADITSGPLLRRVTKGNRAGTQPLSEDGVNRIVMEACRRAGLDAGYSAHSLRAGFVTYAYRRGVPSSQIAHQTRHTSLASVATYTRLESVWDDNAVTALGL